jgi:ubiquinol-cytochrome c reductase iron-sulfur subunit
MTEITEKYLTLRGANNDIYFFQKRVSEKVAAIIGTSFVKTSLRTKDLSEAISSRDDLVEALNELENSVTLEISDNSRSIMDNFGISLLNENEHKNSQTTNEPDQGRRKVLIGLTAGFAAAGVAFAATPFVTTWNPSARAKAIGSAVKVDVSKMMVGQQIQVSWRKQPILIIRHSPSALSGLASVTSKLADPNSDSIDEPYKNINATRSLSTEYSVLSGVCTHLGCSPKYYPEVEPKPWDSSWAGGFFCPCHGSMFDLVGRVYKGVPAPTNLTVPPHFFEGSILTIGEEA